MDGRGRAKDPVSPMLAGPYGHPFHPLLVTVPIGAWVCSVVFDIASLLTSSPDVLATGALWLIGIGVLGALAAASIGWLDLLAIPSGTPARRTAVVHACLNLTATALFGASFAVRYGSSDSMGATAAGPLALSVLGLIAVSVSGYLGGKLAYRYGVRVADETVQEAGFSRSDGSRRPTVPVNPRR